MGTEIAIGRVADIGGGVGGGCVRVEGAPATSGGLIQLKEVCIIIFVDTVHIYLKEVAGVEVGAIHPEIPLDIPAIREPVIENKEILCKRNAVYMFLKAIVIGETRR